MKRKSYVEIETCYRNGDLAAALAEAAEVVQRVGEDKILHVLAYKDEAIAGWYVDVAYRV